jgi:hypothetical protein
MADLQAQGHNRHRSVQDAICQNENASQRHDTESDQHQDQHGLADLDRDIESALLPASANSATSPRVGVYRIPTKPWSNLNRPPSAAHS